MRPAGGRGSLLSRAAGSSPAAAAAAAEYWRCTCRWRIGGSGARRASRGAWLRGPGGAPGPDRRVPTKREFRDSNPLLRAANLGLVAMAGQLDTTRARAPHLGGGVEALGDFGLAGPARGPRRAKGLKLASLGQGKLRRQVLIVACGTDEELRYVCKRDEGDCKSRTGSADGGSLQPIAPREHWGWSGGFLHCWPK